MLLSCQICWLCSASKGNVNDIQDSFLDTSETAPWWQTYLASLPWDCNMPPPYAKLVGFKLDMIQPDLLHCLNLGVSRMLCGSILRVLIQEKHVFEGGNIEDQLKSATNAFRSFARARGFHVRMKKLTKSRLSWATDKYAELTCSGHDNYVVGLWLQEVLESGHTERYPEFATMLWAINNAMSILYGAGRFLTDGEKDRVRTLGSTFLRVYMQCAGNAVRDDKLLFRVIPKIHALQHALHSPRCVNPACYSTWMDEDFLKKMARVLVLTSAVTSQKRILQRWLLQLPECWRKQRS